MEGEGEEVVREIAGKEMKEGGEEEEEEEEEEGEREGFFR